jgi:hypothetical protein
MPRKRSDTVQTALRLPREMLDQLRKSRRPVSEEIRERLARSLFEDGRDPNTRQFAAEIVQIAEKVRRHFALEWHADMNAYEAFVAAVVDQMASHKPTDVSLAVPALFGEGNLDDPPAVVGRVIAREYRHDRQELEAMLARQRQSEKSK